MTLFASRPADFGADMRAALLSLSTRIAEAQHEDAVCRSVVEGLQQKAFGFDGVALFLAGTTSFEPALLAKRPEDRLQTAAELAQRCAQLS